MANSESPAFRAGKNIKNILKKRHISQECFAEKMDVDPRTVGRWTNIGIDSLETIFEVCRVLDVRIEDLVA